MSDSQPCLTDIRERREVVVSRTAVAMVTSFFSAGTLLPPAVCKASLPIAIDPLQRKSSL